MSTTRYDLGRIFMIDVQFLNETTVVVGTSLSALVLACYGMSDKPYFVNMSIEGRKYPLSLLRPSTHLKLMPTYSIPSGSGSSVRPTFAGAYN